MSERVCNLQLRPLDTHCPLTVRGTRGKQRSLQTTATDTGHYLGQLPLLRVDIAFIETVLKWLDIASQSFPETVPVTLADLQASL